MFIWPWIDKFLQKRGWQDASVYLGIVAVCLLVGITVFEAAVPH
jgi:hypothetical protein